MARAEHIKILKCCVSMWCECLFVVLFLFDCFPQHSKTLRHIQHQSKRINFINWIIIKKLKKKLYQHMHLNAFQAFASQPSISQLIKCIHISLTASLSSKFMFCFAFFHFPRKASIWLSNICWKYIIIMCKRKYWLGSAQNKFISKDCLRFLLLLSLGIHRN